MPNEKSRGSDRTRNWTVVLYPESAPENWRDILDALHIEWVESPLHEVMAAALFYQYLSEKDSEFLKNNNYTKEEVMSGFKQLLMQSGYTDLLCLVKAEE